MGRKTRLTLKVAGRRRLKVEFYRYLISKSVSENLTSHGQIPEGISTPKITNGNL